MKSQDEILFRQFLLYFVLPLTIIIIGTVIGVNLLSEETTVIVDSINPIPGNLDTEEVEYLFGEEITETEQDESPSEPQINPDEATEASAMPKPTRVPLLSSRNEAIFYGGVIVCGGLMVLILGAGVFYILLPSKKNP